MLTPEEELALLAAAALGLEQALQEAHAQMLQKIRDGIPPRDAVQQVLEPFQGEMAATMAAGLSAILGRAVGSAEALAYQVGPVSLSARLYAESQSVAEAVHGIVTRHVEGFQDSRKLALELFEGYTFRKPDAEPIQFNPSNPRLPRYMREALLTDGTVRDEMRMAFARLQVNGLSTQALRAAYTQVLDAVEAVRKGAGKALLDRQLEVAFYERMRYFATRISRTELHKAYAEREAVLLLEDADVEFVQIRRAAGRNTPCICELLAGRNQYGLGSGVYPKLDAPVPPFHPHCQCVQSPRLDLTGRKAEPRDDGADAYFLNRLGERVAGRIMGSQAKLDRVLKGSSAVAVVNSSRDWVHMIRPASQIQR